MRIQGSVTTAKINNLEIKFFVERPGDEIQREHFEGRFYEIEELNIIVQHFTPGSIFLDIGANVGNHVICAGRILNAAFIHAIEPNPAAYEVLRLNILLNKLSDRVMHHAVGLSDTPGVAHLHQPQAHNLGGTMLVPAAEGAANTFPVLTGDSLFSHMPIHFVKLDAEGLEINVLNGMKNVIARNRPNMFIEVDNQNDARFQQWVQDNQYKIVQTFRRYPVNQNYMIVPA